MMTAQNMEEIAIELIKLEVDEKEKGNEKAYLGPFLFRKANLQNHCR